MAVLTDDGARPVTLSQRDHHVQLISEKGRMAWQRTTGCGRCSLTEAAIGGYKAAIRPMLRARALPIQAAESAMAVHCSTASPGL